MDNMSYVTLALYFIAMLGIGLFAYKNSTSDMSGYLLGGRKVSPQVTALSAGASDMSGWMLMGLPGAMFVMGYETIFIAIGLTLGALINYIVVAPKLRVFTEVANDALTIPEFFANRFCEPKGSVRVISAVIIVLFFTLYTSAGLVAGGKLFESAFGLSYHLGLIVTLAVVVPGRTQKASRRRRSTSRRSWCRQPRPRTAANRMTRRVSRATGSSPRSPAISP